MYEIDRMFSWIEFFDKIRYRAPDTMSIAEPTAHAGVLNGFQVFERLVGDLINIKYNTSLISDMESVYFRNFSDSELPVDPHKHFDIANLEANTTVDSIAVLHECSGAISIGQTIEKEIGQAGLAAHYLAIYATLRANVLRANDQVVARLEEKTDESIKATRTSLDDDFSKYKQALQAWLGEEKASHLRDIETALEIKGNEIINTAKTEIEIYKREFGANLVVKDADRLWQEKSNTHKILFYIFGFIFISLVLISIGLPTLYWSHISTEIIKLEPLFKDHIIGAIVLLLIPVLGVAWILRLFSRFTLQNMILADDAQMRRVMAQTYVKLVSNDAIKDPEDRAIILTALFRPLPGTHGEDISPPTIADILKSAGK